MGSCIDWRIGGVYDIKEKKINMMSMIIKITMIIVLLVLNIIFFALDKKTGGKNEK